MTIYISHSRSFEYQTQLYQVLQNSSLAQTNKLIFPHQNSSEPYPTKELFLSKKCDLVIAEVSFPGTGQGIELGWADLLNIPVICIYKKDHKIAGSLKIISSDFLEYENLEDILDQIQQKI